VGDIEELSEAIRRVAAGGTVVDPRIVEVLVASRRRLDGVSLEQLTAREQEVLAEIARGRTNAAISESLVLSQGAVEKHISSIFAKLGLASSTRCIGGAGRS
jgi:DNA-binding NarL/FixJ family response regulator